MIKVHDSTKTLLQGIVKDTDGHVLPGVSVVLKETTLGVATDMKVGLPSNYLRPTASFGISFVGMQTKEVKWRGEKS